MLEETTAFFFLRLKFIINNADYCQDLKSPLMIESLFPKHCQNSELFQITQVTAVFAALYSWAEEKAVQI